jgi:hypothetical protein
MMKIRKPSRYLILILSTALLLGACSQDVVLSPEVVELEEGPVTYGTVNLDITHYIPLGIGEIVVETSVPLQIPVKRGDRFIVGGISEKGEAEGIWDLAGAGDFVGISTTVIVPMTYEIGGMFENCVFTFEINEIMHFSQVKTADVLALGDIAVDLGEDEKWEYHAMTLTSQDPKLDFEGPNIVGTITLGISNASMPPDISLICPYPTSSD